MRGLLVQRAGVDHRLRLALAAEDDHQVADHRRAALVVEFDDVVLRSASRAPSRTIADSAHHQLGARGDHRLGLLAAQHRPGDLGGVGEVGQPGLVDDDARDLRAAR